MPRRTPQPPAALTVKYASLSTVGRRERQEDACVAFKQDGVVVVAVADGLGGGPNGDKASKTACDSLLTKNPDLPFDVLFHALSGDVRATRGETTLTVCVIDTHEHVATFAWAGDCTGLVMRPHKKLKKYEVVYKTKRHGYMNMVTRCLGSSYTDATPDVERVDILPGDRILIVSDGFDEGLGLDDAYARNADVAMVKLFELQKGGRGGKPALEWLEQHTRAKGATDNATAILVALSTSKSGGPPPAEAADAR